MLTKFQVKALTIIRDNEGIRARSLSEKLWPDSPAHKRSYKGGANSSCTGKGAWLSAGSYVGRLMKKGWVRIHLIYTHRYGRWGHYNDGYEITAEGKRVLTEAEEENEQ